MASTTAARGKRRGKLSCGLGFHQFLDLGQGAQQRRVGRAGAGRVVGGTTIGKVMKCDVEGRALVPIPSNRPTPLADFRLLRCGCRSGNGIQRQFAPLCRNMQGLTWRQK